MERRAPHMLQGRAVALHWASCHYMVALPTTHRRHLLCQRAASFVQVCSVHEATAWPRHSVHKRRPRCTYSARTGCPVLQAWEL